MHFFLRLEQIAISRLASSSPGHNLIELLLELVYTVFPSAEILNVGRLVSLLTQFLLMALEKLLFELGHFFLIKVIEQVHHVLLLTLWAAAPDLRGLDDGHLIVVGWLRLAIVVVSFRDEPAVGFANPVSLVIDAARVGSLLLKAQAALALATRRFLGRTRTTRAVSVLATR